MRFKILSLLAALFFVTACASQQQETASSNGSGDSNQSSATVTTDTVDNDSAAVSKPTPGSERDFIVNVGDRVFFGFDQAGLSSDAQATLAKQAAWLRNYPAVTVTIEGHADERGTREYNLALGERRANSAKEFLVSQGVNASRINVVSFGKERPAVEGANEEAWAQNRRAVTVINGGANS